MQFPARIGKYELLEFLGGGMSHVYRAVDTVIGRTVALKILTEAGCQDEEAKARFLAEARMAGNIAHDNIISIYDFGEDDQGRPFMVMEFLTGEDLRHAIRNGNTGDLKNKLRIALQIARGLNYIHGQKIVHRDVKPENVHITKSGLVKLMDFGIAKTEGLSMTRAGYMLGTPYYMAPEQVTGGAVTELVDVYAFGIVLFELITGTKPINADTVERIFYSILNERIDPAPLREAGAPPGLIDLVTRCTAKVPADRIQGFEEIATRIETLLEPLSAPTAAIPGPELPAPRRTLLSRPVVGALIVLVGLALAGVSTFFGPFRGLLTLAAVAAALGVWLAIRAYIRREDHGRRQTLDLTMKHEPVPQSLAEVARPAGGTLPISPPVPPPAPPSEAPGEFTRMFPTAPKPAEAPPAAFATGSAPSSAPSVGSAPEFTQMFRMPGRQEGPGTETTTIEVLPDVSLVISNCMDIAHVGKVFRLDHFPFRIGRPGGDLPLPFDPAISREHAEVDFSSGGFTIRDLGASNGTFVNGQRLSPGRPEPLLFAARILLGSNTELTFVSNELEDLPDLTGWLVAGRYTLVEKLFASAKSVMYRAEDRKLPQSVAVKILSPGLARHPGYREQFEQESNVACRLRHPGICRMLDYGETELPGGSSRSLYICMEYLEGRSLAKMMAAGKPFELERVAGWLEKIADALDYVHSQGIVHGALKPTAVLFDSHGNPYLADFALAVSAKDRSHYTLIGSPAFLAPEQWENAELMPATDQYSLAALTYLMITGSHPHEGQEHPAVRKRNLMRGPIPAHEMAAQNGRPEVPQRVSRVLQLALATDPAARFGSTTEFARKFREAVRNPAGGDLPLVFLSYQRKTGSPWTILLREKLEREYGCRLLVDVEQRDTGGPFPQRLERDIQRCDVFICLLASTTLDSEWVRLEIEAAHRSHKPMVPVFQESFQFPGEMNNLAPSLQALLQSDGVKFLDEQNLFIPEAIAWLGRVIRTLASH